MAAGATYHATLAHELQQLGFGLDRIGYNGVFEIAGIDNASITYFSARRNEIEDELAQTNTTSDAAPALAASIAKSTRSSKLEHSTAERASAWIEAAHANGIALDQLEQRARDAAHLNLSTKEAAREPLTPDGIATLAAELTATCSVFDRRDLVRATTATLVGQGLTSEQITRTIDQLIEQGNVVALGQDSVGQARYSTPERIHIEREVVATAARLSQSTWHSIETTIIRRHCTEHKLSGEQSTAAISACASNRIAVIEGAPGVGKTTLLAPIVESYREAGCKVIGGAQAWRIANMLRDDLAVESRATASWLYRADHDQPFLDPRTLLVIDEAGLLSSEDTHTLLQAVERSGAKLLLVGDRQQLQAIGGAAGLALVARAVEHTRVSTIVRQHDAWVRGAITAFGRGDAEQALTAFTEHGNFIEADGARAALQTVGDTWAALRQQHPTATTLLLAKTNKEVIAIGREIRARLRAEGLVYGPDITVRTATPSGHTTEITLAAGDQIRFLTRCDKLGVINGSTGTVVRVSGAATSQDLQCQRIEADVNGKRITFSPADLADDKGRARLGLAYASTIFGSQGLTVDQAVVLMTPAFDRHDAYVAASRARHSTVLVTNKKAIDRHIQLGRVPAGNSHSATISDHERRAWMAQRLARSRVKESTLDVIELDQLSLAAQQSRIHQPVLDAEVALER